MYLNDLATELNNLRLGLNIQGTPIARRGYRDNMVVMSDNEHKFQDMLNIIMSGVQNGE